MVDPLHALGAASRPEAPAPERSAVVIGNVGKLGEELVNTILGSPRYTRVAVGVRGAMRTVVPKLVPVAVPADRAAWDPGAPLGRAPDDAFICVEPARESYWKLATPYVAVVPEEIVALALRLRAAGARRLAVVTPLDALEQLGTVTLRNADEVALVQAGFEQLVILRPSAQERDAPSPGVFEGIADFVLRTLRSVMMPKRLQPIRVRHAAQVAVEALATFPAGVHFIGAARLRELAGEPDA